MHKLCDRCCEYHDTNGGMVLVDDDAYCNECYEQMIEEDETIVENKNNTVILTPRECEHLADALEEWHDVVGCKDCEIYRGDPQYDPNDEEKQCIGLSSERYENLMHRLQKCIISSTD